MDGIFVSFYLYLRYCHKKVVPLGVVYQAPSYEPNFTLLAWFSPNMIDVSMFFICRHCRPAQESITWINEPAWLMIGAIQVKLDSYDTAWCTSTMVSLSRCHLWDFTWLKAKWTPRIVGGGGGPWLRCVRIKCSTNFCCWNYCPSANTCLEEALLNMPIHEKMLSFSLHSKQQFWK